MGLLKSVENSPAYKFVVNVINVFGGGKKTSKTDEANDTEIVKTDENTLYEFDDTTDENSDATKTKDETKPDRYTERDENGNIIVYEKDKNGKYVINKEESIKATLEEMGVKADDDGNKYVEVVDWVEGKPPKDDMEVNNCLSRIAKNYKPEGMSLSEAMEILMELNSDIYDAARGTTGGEGKLNTTLFNGDKIKIPAEWLDNVTSEIEDTIAKHEEESDDEVSDGTDDGKDDGTDDGSESGGNGGNINIKIGINIYNYIKKLVSGKNNKDSTVQASGKITTSKKSAKLELLTSDKNNKPKMM